MSKIKKEQFSKKSEKANYLVAVFVPLILVVLSSSLAYYYGLNTQLIVSNKQKRQQAYVDLMGQKAMLRQLYVSRVESTIFFDYYQARWKLLGSQKESLELQEAINNLRRAESLAIEIAKTNQKMFETIGLIRISFPSSTKLNELTEKIYRFNTPVVTGDPAKMNLSDLEAWKGKAVKNLQDFVEREYSAPIDELLTFLTAEITKDQF